VPGLTEQGEKLLVSMTVQQPYFSGFGMESHLLAVAT